MGRANGIKDRYGLPLSTTSTTAAERYEEGVDLLMAQDYGPEEKFQQAIDADEGFALPYAAMATMLILRMRMDEAKESIRRAQSLSTDITTREQRSVEGMGLYVNGLGPKAVALIREHLAEYPRDALMLTMAWRMYLQGCSGAGVPDYPQQLFGLMKGLESQYPDDDWAFLARYSFAHHETGRLEEARRLGERSVELRSNAVASHSVAHVFFETGDHSGGSRFLGDWIPSYDQRAPFHVHLSWHLALFELAMGHYQRALTLYEDEIRPSVVEKSPTSLMDSGSLTWRLRIYGEAAPPSSVEEVRDQAAALVQGPGPAFRDVHAALAFAAAGDDGNMSRLMDMLREAAEKGNAQAGEVTLPIVRGISAFAGGDYDETVRLIEPVWTQHTRMGGSHAQREVFEDTLLEAYLRSEQFEKAEDLLRARLKRRPSARDAFWLGRAQAGTAGASASFQEASQRWQDADPDSPELAALSTLSGNAD